MRIPNFLFPLQQFFEIQEYRFFFQSKFTKRFSQGKVGKEPVNNLHFFVRYIISKHALRPEYLKNQVSETCVLYCFEKIDILVCNL
jgi:hypothetical protein